MDKPRVLQLIETRGPGGAETVVLQLATGLRDQFETTVGLLRDGWLQESLTGEGIKTTRLHLRRPCDTDFVSDLAARIKQERVSLVHAHLFTMSVYGSIAARLANVPSLFTVHGFDRAFSTYHRVWAMRLAGRLSDRVVTVSDYLRNLVVKRLRLRESRAVRIYNGVDLARYNIQRDSNGLVIGTVGRLRPEKGHSYLLDAARIVAEEMPQARFLLVGDGPCRGELERQSQALGLDGRVSFLGNRTDIPSLLGQMSIFVLPSTSEGLSIATLEAQAAGLPAVVTECGGPSEIVSHAETGILVPPADPSALAKAMLCLLRDPDLAQDLGERGRRRVAQQFSLERMLSSYARLYGRLMARGRRSQTQVAAS